MPMSQQVKSTVVECNDEHDFTVVERQGGGANKENLGAPRPPYTVDKAVARERNRATRLVQLEHSIFQLMFYLIETYYRPVGSVSNYQSPPTETTASNRKKRRGKVMPTLVASSDDNCESSETFRMPRKRIHGLAKAYQTEYESRSVATRLMPNIHRDQVDWQVVFAPITGYPVGGSNLAKELNYDSLFDYEDAIAHTALLLANARQHSDLIDGLVLCHGTATKPAYQREAKGYGGAAEFNKLIQMIEQLLRQKKERTEQLDSVDQVESDASALSTWFGKPSEPLKSTVNATTTNTLDEMLRESVAELRKEVNAWEELLDIIDIIKL